MMARRGVLGMIAGGAAALLSGCGIFSKSISYRYRLTVEVDTPQGVKSGSSVIETEGSESNGLQGSHVTTRKTGQAVAVDLPGSKALFALLDGSPVGEIYAKLTDKSADWYARAKALKNQEGVHEVSRTFVNVRGETVTRWPTLVTFTDINDPKTVVRVDPDNAAATLGEGVRIRRITVEMTEDDVTTGIEKRLSWLNNLDAYRTDKDNPFTNALPAEIGLMRMQERVR